MDTIRERKDKLICITNSGDEGNVFLEMFLAMKVGINPPT